jgi:hypothetical protein
VATVTLQRDELGHETEGVEADAGHEPPLVQQPHHQAGIYAPGSVHGRLVTGRTHRDRLHHRSHAVQQRGDDSRSQAD